MHITLNIQSLLSFAFIALIFAPLPILLLSVPVGYMKEWLQYMNYRKVMDRDYSHLESVDAEQLKSIFPHKNPEQLENLADYLNQR